MTFVLRERIVAEGKLVKDRNEDFPWNGMSSWSGNRGSEQTGWTGTAGAQSRTAVQDAGVQHSWAAEYMEKLGCRVVVEVAVAVDDCSLRSRSPATGDKGPSHGDSVLAGIEHSELMKSYIDKGTAESHRTRCDQERYVEGVTGEVGEVVRRNQGGKILKLHVAVAAAEEAAERQVQNDSALDLATDEVGEEGWTRQRRHCS